MPATRILWGAILVVFTIVLAMTWGATQWTAWRLGFQSELGPAWFRLGTLPVYTPPAFFWWWYQFDAYAPQVFIEGAGIAASGGFASIAAAIAMSVSRAREAKSVVTYGSARWATPDEVRAGGLLGQDGVVLGRFERDYLRHEGPEHVLCFAPTRSGKGVGLVVPTLLTWPGSIIVHDIKGSTVSEMRAKARRLKQNAGGLDLVMIDYLQLMSATLPGASRKGFENRVQEVSAISRGLKAMAKELQVPVIALSQLSRSNEKRDDKRPMLSDLRESGSIEQDADVVAFIHREAYYNRDENMADADKSKAEIIIAKQRNGPTGIVQMHWNSAFTRFDGVDKGHQSE